MGVGGVDLFFKKEAAWSFGYLHLQQSRNRLHSKEHKMFFFRKGRKVNSKEMQYEWLCMTRCLQRILSLFKNFLQENDMFTYSMSLKWQSLIKDIKVSFKTKQKLCSGVALTFEKLCIANAQHGKNCVSSPAAKATITTNLPKIDKLRTQTSNELRPVAF